MGPKALRVLDEALAEAGPAEGTRHPKRQRNPAGKP